MTVEARSNVLPTPRVVTTESNGEYRLPALQPGKYTVTFTLSGMQPVTREADVQLGRETPIEVKLDPKTVTETVTVTAESSMVDRTSPALTNGLSADQMKGLPIGQDYRDLIRFIPGVQYTPDTTRGPSAGGSGQDNVYKFDGVNVTLPLFGTLSAEPASHDVAQVTIVRGGAQATQFDRSGGFLVDSVSRSGTNRFGGQISYQFQNAGMTAKTVNNTMSKYDAMHGWFDLNGGGPVVKDKVFFYASYYRPADQPRQRVELLRTAARLRQHAQRRLREGHRPADALGARQRQLSRLASPRDEPGVRRECGAPRRARAASPG